MRRAGRMRGRAEHGETVRIGPFTHSGEREMAARMYVDVHEEQERKRRVEKAIARSKSPGWKAYIERVARASAERSLALQGQREGGA